MVSLDQIISYLNSYKAKYSIEALKNQLVKQGLSVELIDQAIKAVTGEAQLPSGAIPRQPGGYPTPFPGRVQDLDSPVRPSQPRQMLKRCFPL